MAAARFVVLVATVVALSTIVSQAFDDNPLQDFCVAVPDAEAAVFVNGKICKNPEHVTVDDFSASGFDVPANKTYPLGFAVKAADVDQIPGLNTLGLNMVRADFQPYGVFPPHLHPRASEIIVILEGTFYAGFVSSKNRLFAKILKTGNVFVFPVGLVHFVRNVGNTKGMAIVAFNSQNPGFILVAGSVFGTEPPISPEVLTKSFQLDNKTIEYLQSRQW